MRAAPTRRFRADDGPGLATSTLLWDAGVLNDQDLTFLAVKMALNSRHQLLHTDRIRTSKAAPTRRIYTTAGRGLGQQHQARVGADDRCRDSTKCARLPC